MRYLLDTHTFLWLIENSPRLSEKVKDIFLDYDNDLFLSLASIWELAIKYSIGKFSLDRSFDQFVMEQLVNNDIQELRIELSHLITVSQLPVHHRDPFDRLLISQAINEDMTLISVDEKFDEYENLQRVWS